MFTLLVDTAGGPEEVTAYCDDLVAGSAEHPTRPPAADPATDHPNGPPEDHPGTARARRPVGDPPAFAQHSTP